MPYMFFAPALFAGVFLFFFHRYLTIWRGRHSDIPSLPPHLLWGNLINVGKLIDPTRHGDYSLYKLWRLLYQPGCFVVDFRPFVRPVVVIADAQVAEEISRPSPAFPHALGKDQGLSGFRWVLGKESIALTEGEEWKGMRKRFNPGFQPAHLHSLLPLILHKSRIFTSKLRVAAISREAITLGNYIQDLTVDIIGEVVMEHDFKAQVTENGKGEKGPKGMLTALKKIVEWTYNEEKALNPFHRFSLLRPVMLRYYSRILDKRFSEIISSRMASRARKPSSATRSICSLALQNDSESLTTKTLQQTVSQIKTFLFAGEDTTATTVQWLIYNISKRPYVLAKLRAEHDAIFGGRPAEEVMAERPKEVLNPMVYTTAVIKETLRLNPPAGSVRAAPEGSGFETTVDGRRMRLDGAMLFVNHHIIHRNEKYWGPTACDFIPERWFSPDIKGIIAAGAFRTFERGPRACIGQELAMLEIKIILALTCREFDFEKVGYDGVTQEEVYDIYAVTHKPVDRMRMRVKFHHDLKRDESDAAALPGHKE